MERTQGLRAQIGNKTSGALGDLEHTPQRVLAIGEPLDLNKVIMNDEAFESGSSDQPSFRHEPVNEALETKTFNMDVASMLLP